MATLPDLVGRLRLDMSDMDRARGEATQRGAAIGSALGSAVGSLAGGALAAAGAKVTEFVTGSIDAYARLQDAISVTGVKFGEQSASVEQFAQGAAKSFGLSNAAALEAANTFGTFGKAAELTGQPLADFSTQMTGLAGDMASFAGTTPDEAVTALGAAFRGEYDPIERYGVLINKQMVDQKALQMGLAATSGEITKGDEVMATRQLILEQTGQAQGDFARTGDSVANSQKRVAAETENAQAALGEKLAPAYLALLNVLNQVINGVTAFLNVVVPIVQKIWEWKDAIAAVLIVIGILNAQTIAFNVAAALSLIRIAAVQAATTAWTAVQWLLNAALTANPIGLVVAAVAALVAGFVIAYNHSATFRAAVDALFAKLKEFIDWCGPAIGAWATKVATSFGQAVTDLNNFGTAVNNWATKVGTSFGQAVTDVGNWGTKMKDSLVQAGTDMDTFGTRVNELPGKVKAGLASFIQIMQDSIVVGWNRARDGAVTAMGSLITESGAIVNKVKAALAPFAGMLRDAVIAAWNALPAGIRQPIEQMVAATRQLATDILNALRNLPSEMVTLGNQIIQGLLNGLQQLGPQIVSYLTNLIPEPVRRALNISSPSGVMKEIGQQVMQGLDDGISSLIPKLRAKMSQIAEMLKAQGQDAAASAATALSNLDLGSISNVKAQISKSGASGSATIGGQQVSGSVSSSGQISGSLGGKTYNIDARSFGTQLKPQDVSDAIKWASKIGGLVSA